MDPSSEEITALLIEWGKGNRDAFNQLVPLVGTELRRLARRHLRGEPAGGPLETMDLVHEAYLRLVDQNRANWQNRGHFFALAAQAMRRILVDDARRRLSKKRGAGSCALELNQVVVVDPRESNQVLIELDDALTRLLQLDPVQGRVLELRVFGGLTVEETAETLAISPRTVKREFSLARAWLHRQISTA